MTVNLLINVTLGFHHQVKMVSYGRQTVSVDVDTGVLLFDRKPGLFGVERVSHDRSKKIFKVCNFSYGLLSVATLCACCFFSTLGGVFVLKVKWQVRVHALKIFQIFQLICQSWSEIIIKILIVMFLTHQSSRLSSFKTAQQRYGWWWTATRTLRGRWRLRVCG